VNRQQVCRRLPEDTRTKALMASYAKWADDQNPDVDWLPASDRYNKERREQKRRGRAEFEATFAPSGD